MPRISTLELQLARIAVYREMDEMQVHSTRTQEAAESILERCPVCGSKTCRKDYQLFGREVVHMDEMNTEITTKG